MRLHHRTDELRGDVHGTAADDDGRRPESTFQLTLCRGENFQAHAVDKFRGGTWLVLTGHCFEFGEDIPPLSDSLCAGAGSAEVRRR
jgi:hypothetical protein